MLNTLDGLLVIIPCRVSKLEVIHVVPRVPTLVKFCHMPYWGAGKKDSEVALFRVREKP